MTAIANSIEDTRPVGKDQIKVSVIVPVYNADTSLGDCLSALETQSFPRSQYEIIVADDGSTDNTANVARSFDILLVQQSNRGPASARNTGASMASGEVLLFTDADCMPTRDWIARMLEPFDDPQVVAAKGAYLSSQKEVVARLVQIEYEEKYQRLSRQKYTDFVDTYSAAYRKEAFESVGGFDTSFTVPSAEDQELSFRLAGRGYKMVYASRAIVYHKHPSTWWRYIKRKSRFGYWRVLVHWKHPRKAVEDSHTLQVQKIQIALAGLIILGILGSAGNFPPGFGALATLSALGFLVSSLAFIRRVASKDPALAIYAVPFLLARAYGTLMGIAAGLATLPLRMSLRSLHRGHKEEQHRPDQELTLHGPR